MKSNYGINGNIEHWINSRNIGYGDLRNKGVNGLGYLERIA